MAKWGRCRQLPLMVGTQQAAAQQPSLPSCPTAAPPPYPANHTQPSPPTWKRSRSEGTMGLWQVFSSTHAPRELSTLLQSPTLAV